MHDHDPAALAPTEEAETYPDMTGEYQVAPERAPPIRTRYKARILEPIQDGYVFVISDQHYMRGVISRAHRASIVLARALRPWAVVSNGDALDAGSMSHFPVSSFRALEEQPTISDEIRETAARLAEYERMPFVRRLIWNLGNHDARFESLIATRLPQLAGVPGMTLKEHFRHWEAAWRTDFVNKAGETEVVVAHRFKGGIHAGQNNVLWAGCSYVTGHDHMLRVYPITQVNRVIWGVHSGTMAPIDSKLFLHYTEDRPVNWQEGFVILAFRGGHFIGPELVHVLPDGRVVFRGNILKL